MSSNLGYAIGIYGLHCEYWTCARVSFSHESQIAPDGALIVSNKNCA